MTPAPPPRFAWTRGRVTIAILLALHWVAVLTWALPDSAWRERLLRAPLPLPTWNTHRGERGVGFRPQPAIQSYLMATAQTQRWRVFLPRRPNVAFLELVYATAAGDTARVRLSGPGGRAGILTPRWRFLEWGLSNPARRTTFVPAAQPALARALGYGEATSVRVTKWAYPVPLLTDDGTGNPRFSSGSAWRQRTRDATDFVPIDLGTFVLGSP